MIYLYRIQFKRIKEVGFGKVNYANGIYCKTVLNFCFWARV